MWERLRRNSGSIIVGAAGIVLIFGAVWRNNALLTVPAVALLALALFAHRIQGPVTLPGGVQLHVTEYVPPGTAGTAQTDATVVVTESEPTEEEEADA